MSLFGPPSSFTVSVSYFALCFRCEAGRELPHIQSRLLSVSRRAAESPSLRLRWGYCG
jgi:hypothetical protein